MGKATLITEEQRQIVRDLERKDVLLKTINDFALRLLEISTSAELLWYVARQVVARMGFDDCVIYLLDEDRRMLRQVAAIGAKNPYSDQIVNALKIPIGQGVTGQVARTKQPIIVDNLAEDSRYIPDLEPALSEICVPLIIDDEVVGAIDCEDPRPAHFGEEHLEVLVSVAAMTSAKLKIIADAHRSEERNDELRRLNEQLREEIVERKRAEMELRLVTDNLPVLITRVDKNKCLVFANKACEAWYKRSPAELLGTSIKDVHGPRYKHFEPWMDQALSGRAVTFEDTVPYPDGNTRHIQVNYIPDKDETGQVLGFFALVQDITGIKRQEEAIRTRDAWLRGIMENSPIEIVLKDTEGRFMMASENIAEIFGISMADFIGSKTSDYLPQEIADIYMSADRRVVETGQASQQEVREEIDGNVRYSLNQKFPLRDDTGDIVGVCSLTSDVTEIKEAEARLRQAQKLEAVGQLTGGVAHDFNNLLAVIVGSAEMIEQRLDPGDKAPQAILHAAKRGAELTQRLLAFSRRQPLRPRAIELGDLVTGMLDLLARTLGAAIDVKTAADHNLWRASADPGQVENALLNLAINARDAMPAGGRLTIECRNVQLDGIHGAQNSDAAPGDYVVLAVSDTGTGMSAEVQAHAFEPFFTTKEVGQGSGLGLSMVYGFAKQSGGHIAIYSEHDTGTTVKLYLPRSKEAAESDVAAPNGEAPEGRGETVLVLEDNAELRALAVTMLEGLGYKATAVADATEAHKALATGEKIDLVLSDVILPGGTSGPAFAEEARALDPQIKVIFMSGYPTEAAKRSGLFDTSYVLLNKPFRRYQLATALRNALD